MFCNVLNYLVPAKQPPLKAFPSLSGSAAFGDGKKKMGITKKETIKM